MATTNDKLIEGIVLATTCLRENLRLDELPDLTSIDGRVDEGWMRGLAGFHLHCQLHRWSADADDDNVIERILEWHAALLGLPRADVWLQVRSGSGFVRIEAIAEVLGSAAAGRVYIHVWDHLSALARHRLQLAEPTTGWADPVQVSPDQLRSLPPVSVGGPA